jgi:protoporphyrinogen oxidase
MTLSSHYDIVILGTGITGLTAAYLFEPYGSVCVIDAASQVGGVIQTRHVNGFLLEEGPDCFMNQNPAGLDFALELGLRDQLIESKDYQRAVWTLQDGEIKTSDYADKAINEFLGARKRDGVNPNAFLSFKNGMNTWPQAIAHKLGDRIKLNTPVENLNQLNARAILSTLPAVETARLLGREWPQFKTTTTTSVFLGYHESAFERPLNAFGMIIPTSENRAFSGATFATSKFDFRAPPDHVLIRLFTKLSPEAAKNDFERLFKPKREAVLFESASIEYADPKIPSDHFTQVEKLEKTLPAGFFIAGSPYRGVGISDCVIQAQQATNQIKNYLD